MGAHTHTHNLQVGPTSPIRITLLTSDVGDYQTCPFYVLTFVLTTKNYS